MKKKISVIIPVFNRREILKKTLLRIKNQQLEDEEYEIILVDDGSTEDLPSVVSSLQLSSVVKIVKIKEKTSNRSLLRNIGADHSAGEVLIFLDSDIMIMSRTLENHYNEAKNGFVSLGYNVFSKHVSNEYPFQFSDLNINDYELDYRPFGLINEVATTPFVFRHCTTGNLALQRKHFDLIGGFDESFTEWGFEDTEFGYRLWKNNIEFVYNKSASAIHHPHLRHISENNPYLRMGRHFLKIHPVLEVEIYVSGYYKSFIEHIELANTITQSLRHNRTNNTMKFPFEPDLLVGSSEMPMQAAKKKISLLHESAPDFCLFGLGLPYDDGEIESLVISPYWRYLPIDILNRLLYEAFRVSKRVWIQTLQSSSNYTYWKGQIADLKLVGSDSITFIPVNGSVENFELVLIK